MPRASRRREGNFCRAAAGNQVRAAGRGRSSSRFISTASRPDRDEVTYGILAEPEICVKLSKRFLVSRLIFGRTIRRSGQAFSVFSIFPTCRSRQPEAAHRDRFTASYDSTYGSLVSSSSLTVSGSFVVRPAASRPQRYLERGIISSNASSNSSLFQRVFCCRACRASTARRIIRTFPLQRNHPDRRARRRLFAAGQSGAKDFSWIYGSSRRKPSVQTGSGDAFS